MGMRDINRRRAVIEAANQKVILISKVNRTIYNSNTLDPKLSKENPNIDSKFVSSVTGLSSTDLLKLKNKI